MPRVVSSETNRVGKLKSLGNAIVPQVAFLLMQAMQQADGNAAP